MNNVERIPRWIEAEELHNFTVTCKTPNKREAWIRNELNLIYPGEYTPPKVAEQIKVITPQGLRKLEQDEESRPRQATLIAFSNFYQIPIDTLTSENPERFYLGKPHTDLKIADLRGPHYKLSLQVTLERPDGQPLHQELISNLKLRHMDYEQLCDMIAMMENWIKNGLSKQSKVDAAYDKLKGNS